jgi:hypothetical protein
MVLRKRKDGKGVVTPVNPPRADKNRSPGFPKLIRFTGFRLEFIRLRRAGMTKKRTVPLFSDSWNVAFS